MFPFLIGRIRTDQKLYETVAVSITFPFLIGRIRTEMHVCPNVLKQLVEFPFLIGRIRTRCGRS